MKKILLMLAMLLPCVGAWAEVAPLKVSTDAEKYYYVIKNLRSGKYAFYNGDNSDIKQKVAPTSSEEVNNYSWYLTADGENYKLHNLGTQYTYAAVNSFTPTGTTVYIKENPYREGYVVISKNATVTTSNSCWDDQDRNQAVGKVGWYEPRSNDNEGTSWTFVELDAATEVQYTITDKTGICVTGSYDCCAFNGQKSLPRTKNLGLTNVEWNENAVSANIEFPIPVSSETITNPTLIVQGASWANDKKWRAVEVEGVNYVKVQTAAINYANTDALWAIYPALTDGCITYKIKNLKTNSYVKVNTESTGDVQGNTKPVTLEADGTAFEYKVRTGSNYHFAYTNTVGNELRLSINSSGNTDVFLGVLNGSHNGNDIACPDYVGNMTFPVTVSSNKTVNPITICSFAGKTDNFHWYADGNNAKIQKNPSITNSTIASYLWAIYPSVANGEIVYTFKNFATNKFIATSVEYAFNNGTHDASTIQMVNQENATEFKLTNNYGFYYTGTNGVNQFLSWGSSNTASGYLGIWAKEHDGAKNKFPTVKYNLEVGSTGYATLYSPVAGTFAGEVKTYAIESASGNSATLEEKNGVAANQGVIVEATPGTYTFTAGAVSSDWTSNQLLGSAVNTYVEGEAYVLALVDGIAALTLAELNKNANGETGDSHFLNNAGKAYLPASAVVSGARSLFFNNGTTGIEETIVAPVFNANAPIYDLSGRRVNNAVKGGIYIQNGKKFIVK